MKIKRLTLILLVAVLIAVTTANVFAAAGEKIKLLSENIVSGGPPPDGIPPIEEPNYISIAEADEFLAAEDAVFVAELDKEIYVFPQSIMVWHEIVNKEINGEKLSISYCPLTGSAIGYYGNLSAGSSDFGTSGKLVNSNLIMYDRETESYWSQILGQAISGPLTGEKLDRFQLTWTNWSNIKAKYERANVLSNKTGFSRDYTRDPYGSYRSNQSENYYVNENLFFDVLSKNDSLNRKDIVIAGEYKGQHFAVEKEFVVREKEISFKIAEEKLNAVYEPELDTVKIRKGDEELVVFDVMWFGWYAFYPEAIENLMYIGLGRRGRFFAEEKPANPAYTHFHQYFADSPEAGHGGAPGAEGFWLTHVAVTELERPWGKVEPGVDFNFMITPPPELN